MSTRIHVAWWNLENLFDHEHAPRHPELASVLRGELTGWTAQVRDRKIDQLATIIMKMFGNVGPDLLGVCEVENEDVLRLLANRLTILTTRQYLVLGHASPDARGIDVSFIYDPAVLTAGVTDHQVVVKRSATRDVFWATMNVTGTNQSFVAVANHWPSRTAGQYMSEPHRMLVGETLSYVLSSEILAADPKAPVLVMGDFNDEPFNRSMQEYLLGSRDPDRVKRARNPMLMNLMWPSMVGNDPGTYKYSSNWNMLDQFLVSKGMLIQSSKVKAVINSVSMFRPTEMTSKGEAPRRFGRPSKKVDLDGYSDHFPILMEVDVS